MQSHSWPSPEISNWKIHHYLLFTAGNPTIAQAQLWLAQDYIRRTGVTAGFMPHLCQWAAKVTVIGHLDSDLQRKLQETGVSVQEVEVALAHLRTALEELI
jgi:uroporphyrinogen-III synthase